MNMRMKLFTLIIQIKWSDLICFCEPKEANTTGNWENQVLAKYDNCIYTAH